jgi:hypothetical protein
MLKATRRLKSSNFTDNFFGVVFYISVLFILATPIIIFFAYEKLHFLIVGFMIITSVFMSVTINGFADIKIDTKNKPLLKLVELVNPANSSYFTQIISKTQKVVWLNVLLCIVMLNIPYVLAGFFTQNNDYPLILTLYTAINFVFFSLINEYSINKEIVGFEIFKEIDKIKILSESDKNIFKNSVFEGMKREERFTRISLYSYVSAMTKYIQEKWDTERKSQMTMEGKIFQYQFNKEDK